MSLNLKNVEIQRIYNRVNNLAEGYHRMAEKKVDKQKSRYLSQAKFYNQISECIYYAWARKNQEDELSAFLDYLKTNCQRIRHAEYLQPEAQMKFYKNFCENLLVECQRAKIIN